MDCRTNWVKSASTSVLKPLEVTFDAIFGFMNKNWLVDDCEHQRGDTAREKLVIQERKSVGKQWYTICSKCKIMFLLCWLEILKNFPQNVKDFSHFHFVPHKTLILFSGLIFYETAAPIFGLQMNWEAKKRFLKTEKRSKHWRQKRTKVGQKKRKRRDYGWKQDLCVWWINSPLMLQSGCKLWSSAQTRRVSIQQVTIFLLSFVYPAD